MADKVVDLTARALEQVRLGQMSKEAWFDLYADMLTKRAVELEGGLRSSLAHVNMLVPALRLAQATLRQLGGHIATYEKNPSRAAGAAALRSISTCTITAIVEISKLLVGKPDSATQAAEARFAEAVAKLSATCKSKVN